MIETNRTVKLNKKNQYSVGVVSVDLVGTAGTITYQYWFPKNATFGKLRAKIAYGKEGADEGFALFYQESALPEYETITSLMPIGGNLLLQPRGLEGGAVRQSNMKQKRLVGLKSKLMPHVENVLSVSFAEQCRQKAWR